MAQAFAIMKFKDFKKTIFKEEGFYVLQYADGKEEKVFASEPTHQFGNCCSFFASTPNTRDKDGCCDFGIYKWVNHYNGIRPMKWRKMTDAEATEFKKHLYRFDRPKPEWTKRLHGSSL